MATVDGPALRSVEFANIRRAEAVRLRHDEGLSNTQIADRMGVERSTVYRWIGSTPRDYRLRAYPQEVYDRAVRLRREGYLNREIAQAIGANDCTILRWMGPTPAHLRRARDYSATSLPERARFLREANGYSIRELAKKMDVPVATVGGWVKGVGRYGLLD